MLLLKKKKQLHFFLIENGANPDLENKRGSTPNIKASAVIPDLERKMAVARKKFIIQHKSNQIQAGEAVMQTDAQHSETSSKEDVRYCYFNISDFVIVQARDIKGNNRGKGGDNCKAELQTANGTTPSEVVDNKDGTYTVKFTPRVEGPAKLYIMLNGTAIKDSPISIMTQKKLDPNSVKDKKEVVTPAEKRAQKVQKLSSMISKGKLPSADDVAFTSLNGQLVKMGGRVQTWKRRWCSVDSGYLFYFKTNKDEIPKGLIKLKDYKIVQKVEDKITGRPFSFSLVPANPDSRQFYMAADSALEQEKWIAGLQAEMAKA